MIFIFVLLGDLDFEFFCIHSGKILLSTLKIGPKKESFVHKKKIIQNLFQTVLTHQANLAAL